jgi:hypothetical protein
MAEDLTGGLNNTLANIMGVLVGLKQHKQQQQMQKAKVLSNLFNSIGTPQAFKGMQDAFKKAGINLPDMPGAPQDAGPQPTGMRIAVGQSPFADTPQAPPMAGAPQAAAEPTEEEKVIGPTPTLADTRNEVAAEMGMTLGPNGQPTNVIGGEPLKNFNKEVFQRHGKRLEEHSSLIKATKMKLLEEKRSLALEKTKEEDRRTRADAEEKAAQKELDDPATPETRKEMIKAKFHIVPKDQWTAPYQMKVGGKKGLFQKNLTTGQIKPVVEDKSTTVVSGGKDKLIKVYKEGKQRMIPESEANDWYDKGWGDKPKAEDKAAEEIANKLLGKGGKAPSKTFKSGKYTVEVQ